MKPIDVTFRRVKARKQRWWRDDETIDVLMRLIGMAALFGFVFFALNYGRTF